MGRGAWGGAVEGSGGLAPKKLVPTTTSAKYESVHGQPSVGIFCGRKGLLAARDPRRGAPFLSQESYFRALHGPVGLVHGCSASSFC